MAGVSTKDIKQRIRSMESTRQITRAMEMVAASKLRHAVGTHGKGTKPYVISIQISSTLPRHPGPLGRRVRRQAVHFRARSRRKRRWGRGEGL